MSVILLGRKRDMCVWLDVWVWLILFRCYCSSLWMERALSNVQMLSFGPSSLSNIDIIPSIPSQTTTHSVKQQRLRGQSGIGSDFRTWKTEEEMRMRQQFD